MDNLKLNEISEKYTFMNNICFECDEGWTKIIDNMCISINELKASSAEKFDICFMQIKEKFGTLRIYYVLNENISKELRKTISEIIEKAQNNSNFICEHCGSKGKIRDGNWIHVYCDECEEKYLINQDFDDIL